MSSNHTIDYDIIIAGGGMIGSCLALALAPLKYSVAVIEPVQRGNPEQPSFDDRSTALSRSTQRMFEAMGLWSEVLAAATPIKHIHVSDRGRFGFSHIDAAEQQVEALGYVVINRVLGDVLHRRLAAIDNLDWLSPARITTRTIDDASCAVTVDRSGEASTLRCRLLVAADGAKSSVREMMNISATRTDYGQMAIVGNLKPERAIEQIAYERFTKDGPMAFLPISDGRAAFVWTLPTDKAKTALAMSDKDFTAQLHEVFGTRLGEFSRIGRRAAYPLMLSKANGLVAHRAVLVGNAAHGLHPVAAQGFNLGMRDVATLCDCLFDARQSQAPAALDPGTQLILDAYASWRRSDQGKLVSFTDGLIKLFGDSRKPVAALRDIGMLGFDLIPGLRRVFARHTMGLAGKLPRLSRGVPLQ